VGAGCRELSSETVTRPATSYTASEPNLDIRAFRDEVIAAIGSKGLVDVRSPDEFAGRLLAPAHLPQEQAQRGGHIPTAVNVPWSKAANDDGTFKSDEELKELYSDAGLDWDRDIIAYCRIGERSAHTWLCCTRSSAEEREELRRLVDGIRLAGWRPRCRRRRARQHLNPPNGSKENIMCGATQGGLSVAGIDVTKEAVIQGRVLRGGDPVAGAYVRPVGFRR
jgi:rhodanese-related sulfurtransferase